MPSRKKAKGKARKAAKEAKAKEEEREEVVGAAANQRQEESVGELMHRLVIDDAMPKKCMHGLVPLSAGEEKLCLKFIDAFIDSFRSQKNAVKGFLAAIAATEEEYADEFVDVYASKLGSVISILLVSGTQSILDGNNGRAQLYASLACYFEKYMTFCLLNTPAIVSSTNPVELESADDHTLVQYHRKRIPCSCLDEKYKEVKSVKKMGTCFNSSCSLPGRRVERSKMFCCTRCSAVNYCSVACQKSHWKIHKQFCGSIAEMKAAFKSNQT